MTRSTASSLVVGLLAACAAAAQEPSDRSGSVREQALVERVVVDAHVTAPDGYPIASLTPADFLVRVDGKPIALESVDWVPAGVAEIDPSALPAGAVSADATAPEFPPGRLIVMFFQTDEDDSRLIGMMRMARQAHRFVATLLPTDRVAVVSFDSHLKVRQDFTADHAKLERAIDASVLRGNPPEPDPNSHPSLARHLDPLAARKCAIPELALALVAHALAPIPGGKSLLFFGWGLATVGGLGGQNGEEWEAWDEALQGMAEARVNIFSLDVTNAVYHSLEVYLRRLSELTGGRYEKTDVFGNLAMDRVRRAISGRYVLVFVKPPAPRGTHKIRVSLVGREGRVYARQYYVD